MPQTVYRFRRYDITLDEMVTSKRWATEKCIKELRAELVGDGISIPDEHIGREYAGMTARGFDPYHPPRKDFGR
jgi:hypothetical protein